MGEEQPRMTVPMLTILSAMLEAPMAEWYGLELANRADLKSGTVYPILARLERMGWLVSAWEDVDPAAEGRPRRRLYQLSGEGHRAAPAAVEETLSRITPAPDRPRPHPGWQSV